MEILTARVYGDKMVENIARIAYEADRKLQTQATHSWNELKGSLGKEAMLASVRSILLHPNGRLDPSISLARADVFRAIVGTMQDIADGK